MQVDTWQRRIHRFQPGADLWKTAHDRVSGCTRFFCVGMEKLGSGGYSLLMSDDWSSA